MNKKSYRTVPSIKKQQAAYVLEDEFAKNLSKISVQPRKSDNIFDQINSIMNGSKKSKYSSVEAAVNDMKERSGLLAYQKKLQEIARMIVNADHYNEVKLFQAHPNIKNTFDNYIEDTKGNIDIPAIIDRIHSIHKNDVADDALWDDDILIKYINDKCVEVKQKYPTEDQYHSNLGKLPQFNEKDIDKGNIDMMSSLVPNKS